MNGYDPCLTMMVGFDGTLSDVERSPDEKRSPIAQQIRQVSLAARDVNVECWVVHANPDWSRSHIEMDRQRITELLLEEFCRVNRLRDIAPVFLQGHRWRYARVCQPLGQSCLWDANLRIGLAGDWCLGPDAEHAFLSGLALSHRMRGLKGTA